jgi:hypothetical protein
MYCVRERQGDAEVGSSKCYGDRRRIRGIDLSLYIKVRVKKVGL